MRIDVNRGKHIMYSDYFKIQATSTCLFRNKHYRNRRIVQEKRITS